MERKAYLAISDYAKVFFFFNGEKVYLAISDYAKVILEPAEHAASEINYSVKRDLLQIQKRPTTVSKETYHSVKINAVVSIAFEDV